MSNVAEDLQQEDPARETDEALEQSAGDSAPITEDAPAQETAEQDSEKPKPKGNDPEKRIGQYRARLTRAEERAEYWRDQALRAQQPKAAEKPDPEPAPPKLSDFKGNLEQFAEAQTKYVKDIRDYDRRQAQKAEERRRAESESREKQAKLSEREQQYMSMFDHGRGKHEDFDDVVFDESLHLSQEVLDVATDLENGADILYALAQKPKELARLSKMSERQVAMEMAKMTAKPVSRGSGAPPPPKPAKGAGDSADSGELRDDLSTDEWIRRDRERRAKVGRQ